MAYGLINKTGCVERKGNVQIRLDFFLEPSDPRYEDTYVPIIDPKTEKPTGEYQLVPFHSHFIYLPPTFTYKDVEDAITFHLLNYYKAYQDRWDEVKGGMRHGWATEKRIRPTDYSKDAKRVTDCQDRVDSLVSFSYKPEGGEGKTYPATEIDIGPGAIDGNNKLAATYTYVEKTNPANEDGVIDTFEVWSETTMSGTNKVGTFYGSGTDYTNRDGETIGTVTAGAKRTFTGLTIDVTAGDFAGIYFSVGSIETETTGGTNLYFKAGDQFGTGEQTYTFYSSAWRISIYGTGETAAAFQPWAIII